MRPVPEAISCVHERQKAVEAPARPGSRPETSCNAAYGAPRSSDSRSPRGAEWESRWRPRPRWSLGNLSPSQPEHPQGRPEGGRPRNRRVSAEVVGAVRAVVHQMTRLTVSSRCAKWPARVRKGVFVLSHSSVVTKRVQSVKDSTEGRRPVDKGSTSSNSWLYSSSESPCAGRKSHLQRRVRSRRKIRHCRAFHRCQPMLALPISPMEGRRKIAHGCQVNSSTVSRNIGKRGAP